MRHKKRNNRKNNNQNNRNNSNSGSTYAGHLGRNSNNNYHNNNNNCNGDTGSRPKGFTNLGNTCYLNSILQVLMNVPSFGELLASDGKLAELQGCDGIIIALISLYKNYRLAGTQSALTPSNIIKHIRQKSGRFHRFEQEDSHELLRSLLDLVKTDEIKRKRIPSMVDVLFGGHFLSSVKCNKCNHSSQHLEPFYDISLAISGIDTLSEALKRFSASEVLDGSNKINCEKCKKHEVGSKSTRIAIPPSILTLHFKRFEVRGTPSKPGGKNSSGLSKISRDIQFNETLNLSNYTSDLYYDSMQAICPSSESDDKENAADVNQELPLVASKKPLWYSLFGVVCHSGGLKGGHYTAYVKHNNNNLPLGKSPEFKRFQNYKELDLDEIFKAIRDYSLGRGYFDCDDDDDYCEENGHDFCEDNGNWYYISDTSVSRSNLSSVLNSQAYILFYERVSN